MDFNVFVSYSSEDSEKIKSVLELLMNIQNIKIFFADETISPGSQISGSVINAIKECDIFLVFYSASSKISNYVQQEIGAAKANEKLIIPVLLDGNKPDAMITTDIRYLDLSDKDKYQEEIERLHKFLMSHINKKKQNQALCLLGLLAIGYFLLREGE